MPSITIDEISDYLTQTHEGLVPTKSWGELSFFYNPAQKLPRGTYFCTLKEKDGDNDKASNLSRLGVFRLNFGLSPQTYEGVFGMRPARPAKGHAVEGAWDFTELDVLMPHPIYAWMGWVCILNPSTAIFETIKPMITNAYEHSVRNFNKRAR